MDGGSFQSEVLAYGVDDFIDSHCLAFAVHYLADDTLRQFQVYFFIVYGGMRHNGNDALQVTYTVAHVLCNIVNHFLGELQAVTVYLVAQNVLAEFTTVGFSSSATIPHLKRVIRRSSMPCSNTGARSEVRMSCLPF